MINLEEGQRLEISFAGQPQTIAIEHGEAAADDGETWAYIYGSSPDDEPEAIQI